MPTDERDLEAAPLTRRVIRAFFQVHKTLGPGFLEAVYRRALALELRADGLEVREEYPIVVWYRETRVGFYRADLLVEGWLILELKATAHLPPTARDQLLNCLRGTESSLGLLLHFGEKATPIRVYNPRGTIRADNSR
jgi:GxxExxY protein